MFAIDSRTGQAYRDEYCVLEVQGVQLSNYPGSIVVLQEYAIQHYDTVEFLNQNQTIRATAPLPYGNKFIMSFDFGNVKYDSISLRHWESVFFWTNSFDLQFGSEVWI